MKKYLCRRFIVYTVYYKDYEIKRNENCGTCRLVRENRSAYKIIVRDSERKMPFGWLRHRWYYNIGKYLDLEDGRMGKGFA
jgi:hypothetical protein